MSTAKTFRRAIRAARKTRDASAAHRVAIEILQSECSGALLADLSWQAVLASR